MPIGWASLVVLQWLAIIALAAVVLGVVRLVTPRLLQAADSPPMRMQNQGPAVGSKLPPFTGLDGSGEVLNAAQLVGRATVLLFLSATCPPCVRLADELGGSDVGELADSLIVVTDLDGYDALRLPASVRALIMPDNEVAEVFTVRGRPFAIAVDMEGVVRSKQGLNTVAQLSDLTAQFAVSQALRTAGMTPWS